MRFTKSILFMLVISGWAMAQVTAIQAPSSNTGAQTLSGGGNNDVGGNSSGSPSTPGVNNSAQNIQSSNGNASQVYQVLGTALTMAGSMMASSNCPDNTGMCATGIAMVGMGILSGIQSGQNGSTAGGGNTAAGQTSGYGGLTNPTGPKTPTVPNGFTYNPTTGKVTTPMGTYNASDFSSPAAMTAAGIPADSANAATSMAGNMAKQIQADPSLASGAKDRVEKLGATTAAMGYEEGTSTAAGALAADQAAGAGGGAGLGRGPGGRAPASLSAQVAGLSKNFNGEKIGVAGSNIFDMMTARYKVKEKQNSFLDESEVGLRK